MNESMRLGRIAGIPIGVNWSLLAVFGLLSWSLAAELLPDSSPGHTTAAYWAVAVATTVLFYGGLLAHEMAHSLVSKHNGIGVRQITLWLFGGIAQLEGEASSPGVEFRIAIAGPATSIAASVAFGVLAALADVAGAPGLLVAGLAWLAGINLTLAVFNLVPAAPLDGGRVLRSALWRYHGDRLRSGVQASRAGRAFAFVLMGLGLLESMSGQVAGVWLVFLGWFLLSAARAEESHYLLRGALTGVRVGDVMTANPLTAPPQTPVAVIADDYLWAGHVSAVPLVDPDGRPVGLLTSARVRHLPRAQWAASRAASIACPMTDVPTAAPTDALIELVERMAGCPDGRALVLRDGRVVGIVSPSDISRAVQAASLRFDPPHNPENGSTRPSNAVDATPAVADLHPGPAGGAAPVRRGADGWSR